MKREFDILSISLGSSIRDKKTSILIGDRDTVINIERRGTDGDERRAKHFFESNDLFYDALTIGGTDLYFPIEQRFYKMQGTEKMIKNVEVAPVVCGVGIKATREPNVIHWMTSEKFQRHYGFNLKGKKTFMVCAADRYPMAEALSRYCPVVFGDFLLGLKMPIPINNISTLRAFAGILLPIVTRCPIKWFYPTGENQKVNFPLNLATRFFKDSVAICGDAHYILKYMPEDMEGKVVVTNTTTVKDIDFLKRRGVRLVVTTTPVIDGRSFGTNILEGIVISLVKNEIKDLVYPSQELFDHYYSIIGDLTSSQASAKGYPELYPSVIELN